MDVFVRDKSLFCDLKEFNIHIERCFLRFTVMPNSSPPSRLEALESQRQ